ncbi:MAG: MFS transporter [Spirochaetales bacterium]|nr:MFS transporter [Spirochaetales bacterium]
MTTNPSNTGSGKLPVKVKVGFGIADLGGNLFFTAMGFWALIYLTDTVGVPAALAGLAIMIGKIWDGVTDPIMGFISDRTRTRWGRRRPYLIFGAIPLMLTSWFFFTAPSFTDPVQLTIWATLSLALLNTAYTVVNIPYGSLTPELTTDFHERTSLNGYRFGFAVIGTMLGAAVVLPIVNSAADRRAGFALVGLIFGGIMAATFLTTGFVVREKPHKEEEKQGFFQTYAVVFKNKPYLLVALTYMLHLSAIGFLSGILVYYMKYIHNNEGLTTLAMVMLLGVAMVNIPISVQVSKRIGKKRTYQTAFAFLIVAVTAIFFFGHILPPTFTLIMMAIAGIGIGFAYVPPFAMVPDAIELEARKTGIRREGSYYGIWTFMSKLGQSGASALLGFVLAASGYVPEVTQGPSTIFAIRLLVGPIPAVVLVGAMVLVNFYPIDEKTYEREMGA